MSILRFRKPRTAPEEVYEDDFFDEDEYDEALEAEYEEEYEEAEEEAEAEIETPAAPREDYATRVRKHRRAITIRTILFCALAFVLVGIAVYYLDARTYNEGTVESVANIIRPNAAVYRDLDGKVFCYSRDGANCMDGDGKALWNITYEMQQPMADVNGSVAAIADYNGSVIYVVSAEKVLGSVSTNMPIRAVSVSEKGEVAAVLADSEITWVYLYDVEGQEIAYFRMSMNQAGYPVSVSVSPGAEMVCVSHFRADGADVKSSVAFYNFGSVGQNEIDNYVSGFDYLNEVVPVTGFFNSSSSFAVSDARAMFYSGREIPQADSEVAFEENLLSVFYGDRHLALLFPDVTGEEEYRLDVYDNRGELASQIFFSMDFTDIRLAYDRVYIHDAQSLLIYTVDGKKKFDGFFGKSVDALIPSSRIDKMPVITEDGLERLTLN